MLKLMVKQIFKILGSNVLFISMYDELIRNKNIRASARDFQQFDILTSVDSDEPVQPPFKLRNSKWCSVSSLTIMECSSD